MPFKSQAQRRSSRSYSSREIQHSASSSRPDLLSVSRLAVANALFGVLSVITTRKVIGDAHVNYYVVLGITEDADADTIRSAFRAAVPPRCRCRFVYC